MQRGCSCENPDGVRHPRVGLNEELRLLHCCQHMLCKDLIDELVEAPAFMSHMFFSVSFGGLLTVTFSTEAET